MKTVIISIGGSMIVPNGGPSVKFLSALKLFSEQVVNSGKRLILVCGGGKTARHYISAASEVVDSLHPEDLDWLGIHSTRLNGHLVRTILRDIAHSVVIKNPHHIPEEWDGDVLIAAGWKPGWSTDYVASVMAKNLDTGMVINASNIDYVYTDDPRKNPHAEKREVMSWEEYRTMVGEEWDPGMSAPFDPIASKLCDEEGISVAIVNGDDLENIRGLIEGEDFKGTILS
ncbi:MAG: UMP kinase [bacterium]|nr:UMP kinase [bacterium]